MFVKIKCLAQFLDHSKCSTKHYSPVLHDSKKHRLRHLYCENSARLNLMGGSKKTKMEIRGFLPNSLMLHNDNSTHSLGLQSTFYTHTPNAEYGLPSVSVPNMNGLLMQAKLLQ